MNRKKDLASLQNLFCYTGEELVKYENNDLLPELRVKIFHHLNIEKCERCRALYELTTGHKEISISSDFDLNDIAENNNRKILEKLKQKKGKKNRTIPILFKEEIKPGQIWTTSPEPVNMAGFATETVLTGIPVLIIETESKEKVSENIIRVLPLSVDIDFYNKYESFILDKNSPLGYPTLVEIFNERPMLASNLTEYRGFVPDKEMKKIIIDAQLFKESILSETCECKDADYLQWKQKEFQLTQYLTSPVNESLWGDIYEVNIIPVKAAADTATDKLPDLEISPILETQSFSIYVVQKKDVLFLRFVSKTEKIDKAVINNVKADILTEALGYYRMDIAYIDEVPELTDVVLTIDNREYSLSLKFVTVHDQEM